MPLPTGARPSFQKSPPSGCEAGSISNSSERCPDEDLFIQLQSESQAGAGHTEVRNTHKDAGRERNPPAPGSLSWQLPSTQCLPQTHTQRAPAVYGHCARGRDIAAKMLKGLLSARDRRVLGREAGGAGAEVVGALGAGEPRGRPCPACLVWGAVKEGRQRWLGGGVRPGGGKYVKMLPALPCASGWVQVCSPLGPQHGTTSVALPLPALSSHPWQPTSDLLLPLESSSQQTALASLLGSTYHSLQGREARATA